jgi:hypothetical protein
MEEFIKALPTLLRSIGDDPDVATAAAITAWKRAAGDGLRQHAVPMSLNEGTLVVAVADAVWQKQLRAVSDELIYKTNSILGQRVVKAIELIIDPAIVKPRTAGSTKQTTSDDVPLEVLSAANAISDKQLRQTFIKAAAGILKRQQQE